MRLAGLDREEGLALVRQLIAETAKSRHGNQNNGQDNAPPPQRVSLSPRHIERLLDKTGGNPMLLRLALGQLLSQREPVDPATFITYLETQPQVSSYLLETVQRRLSPDAWRLLSLVAVFRLPVNLYDDALVELSQAADGPYDMGAAVTELQRRHLIDHPSHANLHPTVRDYVYTNLATDPTRRRRLHQVAAEWLDQTVGKPVEAAFHYLRAGQLETVGDVLANQVAAIISRGRRLAALAVVDEALAQARRKRGETSALLRQLLTIRGDLQVGTLQAAEAEADYRQALALSASPAVRANIVWRLAQSLAQRGQAAEAIQLCRDTAAAISSTDTLLLAHLASVECHALATVSRFDEAGLAGDTALRLAGQLAPLSPFLADNIRARTHHTLSNAYYFQRAYQAGIDHSHRLVAVARRAKLRELEYAGLTSLGVLMLEYVGQTDLALFYLDQAVAGFEEIGHSYGLGFALDFKSVTYFLRDEQELALRMLDQAEKIVRQIGDLEGLAVYQVDRGMSLLALGRVAEARALAEQLLAEYTGHDACWHTMYTMYLLGVVQLVEEEAQAALATLQRALGLPAAATDPAVLGDIQSYLALALIIMGDMAEAQQTLDAAPLGDFGIWPELNRKLVRGVLALAQGDSAIAATIAMNVVEQADAAGYQFYSSSAARFLAATHNPPPLVQLPRLLWVGEARWG
jgi:tetratricopeptide (TPR) repeat protein